MRTAVLLGAGFGFGDVVRVGRGVGVAVAVVRTAGAVVWGFLRAAGVAAEWVGVVGTFADEVVIGGGCDDCTRTLPDPPLHAVTARMKQSAAAAFPLVAMSA